MNLPGPGLSPRAIAWALLGQVFWLPLLVLDLQERWQAQLHQSMPPSSSSQPDREIARGPALSLDKLLDPSGAAPDPVQNANSSTGVLLSSAGSTTSSLLDRPLSRSIEELLPQPQGRARSGPSTGAGAQSATVRSAPAGGDTGTSWLTSHFTRAQLLGGRLDLNDLHEGSMSPLAMVERAASASSTDPMAPLPSLWRDPMRQAILRLPGRPQRIATARVIHVPSLSVSRSTEVPLAIQSDGSIDILQTEDNPAVIKEIDSWSRRQQRPAVGSVVPAVIHLHPLEPTSVLSRDSKPAPQTPAPSTAPAAASLAPAPGAMRSGPLQAAPAPAVEVPVSAAPVAEFAAVAAPVVAAPLPGAVPAAAALTP